MSQHLRKARIDRLRAKQILATRPMAPGIEPPTVKQILQSEVNAPLKGGDRDLQHNGLFGDSHKQISLF